MEPTGQTRTMPMPNGSGNGGNGCLRSLLDAAKRSDGLWVIPSDRIDLFQLILREGGHHVLTNAHQADGSYKNQLQLSEPTSGQTFRFDFFSTQPIGAS